MLVRDFNPRLHSASRANGEGGSSFPASLAIPLGDADSQVTHVRVETWHLGESGVPECRIAFYAVLDMSPTTIAEVEEIDFIRSIAATRGGRLEAP